MRKRVFNTEPVCFICRSLACGLAYGNPGRLGWQCTDCLEAGVAAKAYTMTDKQYDEFETKALETSGQAGGEYLDAIGKTDLATLTREEWMCFLGVVQSSYGITLRALLGGILVDDTGRYLQRVGGDRG